MRFFFVFSALLLLPLLAQTAWCQQAAPLPAFFSTYHYTAYTVYDTTSPDAPTTVTGVGGALTLRSNGTYEKHLSIVRNGTPYYFNQTGRFTLAGDSIQFAFTDLKGADVQRGTFQFDPATRHLTLIILGYPTGNKGVYELVAAETIAPPAAVEPVVAPKVLRQKIKGKRKHLR